MKQAGTERRQEKWVLVVDDEADIRELLEMSLTRMGVGVESAGDLARARVLLERRRWDLCLTDMRLPDGSGLELVQTISREHPRLPVAVITAYGSAENAVSALKAGAFDYLSKPLALDTLRTLVRSALRLGEDGSRSGDDGMSVGERELLGDAPAMREVKELIRRLARSQAPVYVTGESGSGKELAARLIHAHGNRAGGPFVAVNCGAIPENLMESEFFGYCKGAFTGAASDRDGFFQAARGGTLFLDEVADLPLSMQVKLLRAIQEKKVRKVGATGEDGVDVRIISATHQDLARCVEQNRFRQDLYYRLNVICLRMPPLREIPEDIPVVAHSVLERVAARGGQPAPELAPDALQALAGYHYPGNVRELENILERAMALNPDGPITADDLMFAPAAGQENGGQGGTPVIPATLLPEGRLTEYLDEVERDAILRALEQTEHNKTAAARLLGITFRALRYRMERLGLS